MAWGGECTAQGAILVSHTGEKKKALSQSVDEGNLHIFFSFELRDFVNFLI